MLKYLTAILIALFALPSAAFAHHPPPEPGTVYQIPPTALCENPEGVVQFQELFISEGMDAAKAYLDVLVRAGECGQFRGGAMKFLEIIQVDRHEGYVWRVLKVSGKDGEVYYTMFGWKDHFKGA